MAEPIACPACGGIDWTTSWSGRFSEEQNLTWQSYVTAPHYELTFDDEDQYDTDTERWKCAACLAEADDDTQDALSAVNY